MGEVTTCNEWLGKNNICTHNLGLLGYCACAKHYDPMTRATTGLAAVLTPEEQAEAERRFRILMPDLFKGEVTT